MFTRFDARPLLSREEIARRVHAVSLARGLDQLATVICLMAISTEAGADRDDGNGRQWWCPANPADPTTYAYPHDSESNDSRSSGYLQQQPGPNGEAWWGTVADRMTLERSANMFLDRLDDSYSAAANNPTLAGRYAQRVQGSSFPDRYAEKWLEAWSILRAALATPEPAPAPAPIGGIVTKPVYTEVARWSPNHSARGRKPDIFALHTQEGDGTAESLAAYLGQSSSQVSYHYTVDNSVCVCDVVDTDQAAWSVGDANARTINLCFAGSRASWTRQQWLTNMGNGIDVAAYLAVQDCRKYGIPVTWLGSGGSYPRRAPGITDHRYITDVIGWGTHTDVGPGFPSDVFAAALAKYANPAPVVSLIDQAATQAAFWIGKRITVGENDTRPTGSGKWAEFTNAIVYWRAGSSAAYAVPRGGLLEAFGNRDYEAGPLGFPTRPHAVLARGGVQAFEGGVLFRLAGSSDGAYVHGAIGDAYAASGWETGTWGWPLSDETAGPNGTRTQTFEHVTVAWSATDGITVTNKEN